MMNILMMNIYHSSLKYSSLLMRYLMFISLVFIFHNTSFSQICGFKPKDATRIDDILRGHSSGIGLREAITIPVIVHVVRHSTDEIVSDATILSQISILNRDFNAKNGDIQNVPTEFDVSDLNTGVYFVSVLRDKHKLFTKKLMVSHQ